MANDPRTPELYRATVVLEEDIKAAVAGVLAETMEGPRSIDEGYSLGLMAAKEADEYVSQTLFNLNATEAAKTNAVAKAVLVARPVAE